MSFPSSSELSRRQWLKRGLALGAGAALPAWPAGATAQDLSSHTPFRSAQALRPLADIYQRITEPVIIARVEILRFGNEYMTRVTSSEGVVGYSMGNNRIPNLISIFRDLVAPFFIGQDARSLADLWERFYYNGKERVYKYTSMPLWNCFGQIEVAVLDILGQVAGQPVCELLGPVLRSEIPVYLSSLRRNTTPEEECAWLGKRVEETQAKSIKIKIGGRMSKNADAYPGRTDALVPYARKFFGDGMDINVDANGSYDAPTAIRVGRMLEDHGVGFFEEPCEWEDFVAHQQVAKALKISVAGGEQDHSLPKWEWMMANGALALVQPDIMYNGGMLRTIHVANMALGYGLPVTTHNPRNNAEYANLLHLAAVLPNLGPFQEFRADDAKSKIPFTPDIECRNGTVKILTAPGMSIQYDPEFMAKAEVLASISEGW
ncbi:mandelate racemase/muconate lactonizing enzyme family protein [Neolewinella lacunae]|uniref:Mandelate racemase/muconate lactonizing enzyme family protein n=1 Tax=Neolewinella lacunae TaxID=1517758 RepID=A0A923PKU6_9BACT|nr:mandelate racemase/muconate lactonizing enzyme family protein [Neolewinella lacunae]MBC6995219.1 mandelate racemase/muconate lactonizing enzyme family protein [Neolewinella lacunae]MDN3635472.1 mandelate racemase/muconate lactonizing enzyme family protein [Neolewinella lacunae]